jgi:hypothetical protein
MSDEWLTYEQVAERLHETLRAARARAFRGRWSKMQGNDGRARVRLPDEPLAPAREPARGASVRPTDAALVHALEGHVETLKAQLAEETAALREHNATLKAEIDHRGAEIDTLKAQLAAANARAGEESAKTAQAIAAFEGLARRLEAMAEARRPWWRRLVRIGCGSTSIKAAAKAGTMTRLIRVFPRRTKATPNDALAYFGPHDRFSEADEVHVDCTFT